MPRNNLLRNHMKQLHILAARRALIPTFCVSLLAGCAISVEELENSQFSSKITDSGLKHFQLEYGPAAPSRNAEEAGPPSLPQGRPPKRANRVSERELARITKQVIEQNQFCTEGFWLMEVDVLRPRPRLRGECNEAATDADRRQFPDTIKRW